MEISINTAFISSQGSPETPLRVAAESGFKFVQWCHHWNDDFVYGKAEIFYIRELLHRYGLEVADMHGSAGIEKSWFATEPYQRRAGVELVRNRIEMMADLGAKGVLVMHSPFEPADATAEQKLVLAAQLDAMRRSLDELLPTLDAYDLCIALENFPNNTWRIKDELFAAFPPERVGLCYDSGHGNLSNDDHLQALEQRAERLVALHLNDNDGKSDQRLPPFSGSIDWERLARIVKTKNVFLSMDLKMTGTQTSPVYAIGFLKDVRKRAEKLLDLVNA